MSRMRLVWLYCTLLAVVGAATAFYAISRDTDPVGQPFQLSWMLLAVAFVITEWLDVDLEVRRQAQTLTFTEAPLALGLVLAGHDDLIIVRIVAGALAVAVIRRAGMLKVLFNAGSFAVCTGAAVLAYDAVLNGQSPIEPIGWLAAMVAISTSYLLSALFVTVVMRIAGDRIPVRAQLLVIGVGSVAALAGAAVALGAAAALWSDGRSWVLLALIGAALGYFFVSFLNVRERHQALAALHSFTTAINDRRGDEPLDEIVVRETAELLRGSRVVVLVPSGDERVTRYEYLDGEVLQPVTERLGAFTFADGLGLAGRHFKRSESGATVAGIDIANPSAIAAKLDLPGGAGLLLVDGRLSENRSFDDEDIQLLETAAGHAATAIHNARLVNELREEATFRARQALHDDVTDLPNSRGLAETLQRPLFSGSRLAVLTIRIDSLREVNETLGRAMGDELLQQAASRLSPLTEAGWCAKTATDEFTIVVRGGYDEAQGMAEQVIQAFDAPVQCADVALAITAGIGIVLAPDHGRETEILLRRASLAASRSRVEGTKVTTWAADRDPYDPQRLAIAADLRDAIPAGELQVHFQPQVDIESGLVTGAEALVRWRHPRLGELRPDQFIAAAEYTGAIDALTEHVLSVAAHTCAGWREQGWDLDVSVNLSARNLANVTFADMVESILDETGLDPAALTLELTESSIMTEAEGAMNTLAAIHDLGVSLSIDDFGTGYSSLAHLRKLPVSEIKIDKSFVFDLTTSHSDEAIVRSMVDLGHHLGLTVVVEGVETVEVRRRLAEMGADRIQGYLLSRPMPVAAFEQWIADRPVRMAELSTSEAEVDAPSRIEDRER